MSPVRHVNKRDTWSQSPALFQVTAEKNSQLGLKRQDEVDFLHRESRPHCFILVIKPEGCRAAGKMARNTAGEVTPSGRLWRDENVSAEL